MAYLHAVLGQTLREAREALHRRSRFSSRNEALDEVCKLLFAHFVAVSGGGPSLSDSVSDSENAANDLVAYVNAAFSAHLPKSLVHEMPLDDFQLRLKPSEHELAIELAAAFEHLRPTDALNSRDLAAEADVLNEVFGAFLNTSFVDEKQLGQYLTPPEVVRFVVDLAIDALSTSERKQLLDISTSKDFGVILDPACGVASFLTTFARQLYHDLRTSDEVAARGWLDQMLSTSIIGFDKSERMVRLALTNLALLGANEVNLHLINSLARNGKDGEVTNSLVGNVGLIVTNPPFGAEFRGSDLDGYRVASDWVQKRPAKVDSEVLFMERYLDWLRPGGRLFAIVPDSVLTNRGSFADLRRGLRGFAEVELVVSLPTATFEAAGTQTKTSVLQLRRTAETKSSSARPKKPAYAAICTDIGFTVGTRGTYRLKTTTKNGDLPAVFDDVSNKESRVGQWVDDLTSADRWDATYHASLPEWIEKILTDPPDGAVFVRDVASLSSDRVHPARGSGDTFRYIEISDVDADAGLVKPKDVLRREAPSRARKLIHAGDVLVSTVRPDRRAVVVVPGDAEGSICSTGFAVLRPRNIQPHVLAHLLRSWFATTQILRNNVGIAYPAIDEACLVDVLLPATTDTLAATEEAASALADVESKWKAARRSFDGTMAEIETRFSKRAGGH